MIKELLDITRKAGEKILDVYKKEIEIEYKDDSSPLTLADKKSNKIIIEGLKRISNYPVLSEEENQIPYSARKKWGYYWCIDPLDGTKEFIKRNGEFTVNIALIYKNEPVLGVVYAPAIDLIYYAEKGKGAFKNKEKIVSTETIEPVEKRIEKLKNRDILNIVASKSHMNNETKELIDNLKKYLKPKIVNLISKGSSLKLCMVAEGSADIYPRIAPTMEWDTAAADAIVRESGKNTYVYNEDIGHAILGFRNTKNPIHRIKNIKSLSYNKENLLNPYFIVI